MKTKQKIRFSLLVFAAFLVLSNTACKKDDNQEPEKKNFPTTFKVDIPDALSKDQMKKKSTQSDTLNGNAIYHHLTSFIWVGEKSAELVQDIMSAISTYNLSQPMTMTFISQDDNRSKNLVVVENSTFDNAAWEFQLTITDALSESAPDGGKGLQVFWNTSPVKGIAILKPYNISRTQNTDKPDAMVKVLYSEAGELTYEAYMLVSINGLPLANPIDDPYSMRTLKMFAGKQGNYIDVYGNSHHPNAKFFTTETGFNYAFVASSERIQDIGVAEVGLPSGTLNSTSREVILKDNSIKNVFTTQIYTVWPDISDELVEAYLYNTTAPGYFNGNGFIQGGIAPSTDYNPIEARMNLLSPYNPYDVANLVIDFK